MNADMTTVSQWQLIETAPKNYTTVLLYQDGTVGEGWYATHMRSWEMSAHVMNRNPTHWMPLPEGPK